VRVVDTKVGFMDAVVGAVVRDLIGGDVEGLIVAGYEHFRSSGGSLILLMMAMMMIYAVGYDVAVAVAVIVVVAVKCCSACAWCIAI